MVANLEKKILIIADHASNFVPKENYKLGLLNSFLYKHIAFDIGVKELSLDLSNRLKCKVIQGKYSRLLIDVNRDLDDPTIIPEIVDRKKYFPRRPCVQITLTKQDFVKIKKQIGIYDQTLIHI